MTASLLEDEHVPLYSVGQVAEMLAVKQAFLRRVDELQVVSPQRSAGRQRRYTRHEVQVIQRVASMAEEGITLLAIRRIIELERRVTDVTPGRPGEAERLEQELAAGQDPDPAGQDPDPAGDGRFPALPCAAADDIRAEIAALLGQEPGLADCDEDADPLLSTLVRLRRERLRLEAEMRLLIAYGRRFGQPRPYRLIELADAAGLSISAANSAYGEDEVAAAAQILGRPPGQRLAGS